MCTFVGKATITIATKWKANGAFQDDVKYLTCDVTHAMYAQEKEILILLNRKNRTYIVIAKKKQ